MRPVVSGKLWGTQGFYHQEGKVITAHFAFAGDAIKAPDSFMQGKPSRYNLEALQGSPHGSQVARGKSFSMTEAFLRKDAHLTASADDLAVYAQPASFKQVSEA